MTLAFGAMAGGLTATAMGQRQGARQQVFWEMELADEVELPLSPAGRFGAFGFAVHLTTLLYTDIVHIQQVS